MARSTIDAANYSARLAGSKGWACSKESPVWVHWAEVVGDREWVQSLVKICP
jgi:hypothetical protein